MPAKGRRTKRLCCLNPSKPNPTHIHLRQEGRKLCIDNIATRQRDVITSRAMRDVGRTSPHNCWLFLSWFLCQQHNEPSLDYFYKENSPVRSIHYPLSTKHQATRVDSTLFFKSLNLFSLSSLSFSLQNENMTTDYEKKKKLTYFAYNT